MLASVIHKIQTALHRQELQHHLGWMNTLTEMDALDALKETTSRLAIIQFKSNESLAIGIDIVLEIDSKTYRNVSKIICKYLTILKINTELEAAIFNTAYAYQRQLYVAYAQFLEVYQAQNKVMINVEKMNLILCRYINATNAMAKWCYFDDQPAPIGTWENVCKVIKCAEKLAILNTNLFMYDDQMKQCSLAALLKQGFMMNTLHKGSYSRLQIQLTEQILKTWATNPLLLKNHKSYKFQYFINMESDHGPERIRVVEKFADYRYWKTTRLVDKIEAYLCAVDTQKPLLEFGLEKMAPAEMIVQLFKKLRVDWCVEGYERQRRKETRNKRNKSISVSDGLEDICRRLMEIRALQLHQAKPSKQAKLAAENWWLVDDGANGFGVDLGKNYSDWVEIGRLIGYTTPEDSALFVIAEIKSIRKQANGNYRAGLALLGTNGVAVELKRSDQTTFYGLMLNKQAGSKSLKPSLIIPKNEYKRGNQLTIYIEGEQKVLVMGVLLSKQHDWVRLALNV